MAGTQDNGTICYSGSPAWNQIAQGDGGDCGVDQMDPDIIYHTYYYVSLERSNNKGKTWSDLGPPNVASLWYPPVEVFGSTVAIGGASLLVTRTARTSKTFPTTHSAAIQVRTPLGNDKPRAITVPGAFALSGAVNKDGSILAVTSSANDTFVEVRDVHVIDLATGKMLGEEKNRTLQFQKQRAEDQCLWTEYTHRSHKVMRYDQFRASS